MDLWWSITWQRAGSRRWGRQMIMDHTFEHCAFQTASLDLRHVTQRPFSFCLDFKYERMVIYRIEVVDPNLAL